MSSDSTRSLWPPCLHRAGTVFHPPALDAPSARKQGAHISAEPRWLNASCGGRPGFVVRRPRFPLSGSVAGDFIVVGVGPRLPGGQSDEERGQPQRRGRVCIEQLAGLDSGVGVAEPALRDRRLGIPAALGEGAQQVRVSRDTRGSSSPVRKGWSVDRVSPAAVRRRGSSRNDSTGGAPGGRAGGSTCLGTGQCGHTRTGRLPER